MKFWEHVEHKGLLCILVEAFFAVAGFSNWMTTAPSRTMQLVGGTSDLGWLNWSLLTKREDHSWHPAGCHRHPIVQGTDLVWKNSSRFWISHPGSGTRRKAERRSTSFLRDCICCLPFSWGFEACRLKILSLFLWMSSSVGIFLSTRRSMTKLSHCTWPTLCARWTASTAPGGATISFVSTTSRSRLSSSDEFPKSSITYTDCTFLRKAVCALADWSWCFVSCDRFSGSAASWNSSMSLSISDPASIHRRRALGLSVRPTAPHRAGTASK